MSENEKAGHLVELIKAYLQRYQTFVKIQWTFNGIFWSGIFGTSIYFRESDLTNFEFIGCAVAIILLHWGSSYLLSKSMDGDKNITKAYRRELNQILKVSSNLVEEKPYFKAWIRWQVAVTIVLVGIMLLFVWKE